MLVAEQENGTTGRRDVVEEGQEGLIRRLAETGQGSEVFRWCVVEGLPAAGAFQMRTQYAKRSERSSCGKPRARAGTTSIIDQAV